MLHTLKHIRSRRSKKAGDTRLGSFPHGVLLELPDYFFPAGAEAHFMLKPA